MNMDDLRRELHERGFRDLTDEDILQVIRRLDERLRGFPGELDNERLSAVRETLAHLLSGGWLVHDGDRAWIREVLQRIEADPSPRDWPVCLLCEEATCDDTCPLRPLRATA